MEKLKFVGIVYFRQLVKGRGTQHTVKYNIIIFNPLFVEVSPWLVRCFIRGYF